MDALDQQLGQRVIDHALARDAALPRKRGADDAHRKMALAAPIMPGMATMAVAVVDDLERDRGERVGQAADDFGSDRPRRGSRRGGGVWRGRMIHRPYIRVFVTDRMATRNDSPRPEDGPQRTSPRARFHGRVGGGDRACEHPGCTEAGEFRAPRHPGGQRADRPPEWRWLCLDHVRAFNAGYNYFSGMSADEIEAAQRPYAGWERETRAFAHVGADRPPRWADFGDPLDAIGARFRRGTAAARERQDGRPLSGENRRDLATLGLDIDADRKALRQRYSELVRLYHPDRNGGDRSHETKLQGVIGAYTRLKSALAFA